MKLLSEMRTSQQTLNYAVNREKGQANQHEILRANNTNWNTVSYHRQKKQRTQTPSTQQKPTPCWKCGGTFSMAHLQIIVGHYTSLCTAKMPERLPPRVTQNSQT